MTRFLGILSHEPCVGKTTTALNLSALLAAAGKRTLIVDCSDDLCACRSLGFTGGLEPATEGRRALLVPDLENLGLLPLPCNDVPGARQVLDAAAFRASCEDWDFVVVDLPEMAAVDQGIIEALDRVIILILSARFSLQQLAGCVNAVTDIKGRFNPSLEIEGVLITLAEPGLEAYERTMRAAGQHFPVDVFPFAIPRDEVFARGDSPPAHGFESALASRATRGYVELAMEVLAHER